MQNIYKIFLHWSATPYDWAEPGHYHAVIDDKGVTHRLIDYHEHLGGHTFSRNSDAVGLSMACMGGKVWEDYPPTEAQIDGMAKEAAKIAVGLKWQADPKFLEHRIMTHAEAGGLRDYPRRLVEQFGSSTDSICQYHGMPHNNYGPSSWHDGWPGGTVERWDLWQLRPQDVGGSGGYELRQRVVAWMKKIHP